MESGIGGGKGDGKGGAFADLGVDGDLAAEALGDVSADGESESGALVLGLGGKKGVEDAVEEVFGDAATGVGDGEEDLFAIAAESGPDLVVMGGAVGDGVGGVDQEVEGDLTEAGGLSEDRGYVIEVALEGGPVLDFVLGHVDGGLDDVLEVDGADLFVSLGGVGAEVGDDLSDALGALAGVTDGVGPVVGVAEEVGRVLEGFGEELEVSGDEGKGVVDLVGDAGGEGADGAHALHVHHLHAHLLALCEVAKDGDQGGFVLEGGGEGAALDGDLVAIIEGMEVVFFESDGAGGGVCGEGGLPAVPFLRGDEAGEGEADDGVDVGIAEEAESGGVCVVDDFVTVSDDTFGEVFDEGSEALDGLLKSGFLLLFESFAVGDVSDNDDEEPLTSVEAFDGDLDGDGVVMLIEPGGFEGEPGPGREVYGGVVGGMGSGWWDVGDLVGRSGVCRDGIDSRDEGTEVDLTVVVGEIKDSTEGVVGGLDASIGGDGEDGVGGVFDDLAGLFFAGLEGGDGEVFGVLVGHGKEEDQEEEAGDDGGFEEEELAIDDAERVCAGAEEEEIVGRGGDEDGDEPEEAGAEASDQEGEHGDDGEPEEGRRTEAGVGADEEHLPEDVEGEPVTDEEEGGAPSKEEGADPDEDHACHGGEDHGPVGGQLVHHEGIDGGPDRKGDREEEDDFVAEALVDGCVVVGSGHQDLVASQRRKRF